MAFALMGEGPPADLLRGTDIYDPSTKFEEVAAWLAADNYADHGHHHHHDVNRHDEAISSFCLTFDKPLHWQHVAAWLEGLVGDDLLRVKGILSIVGWDPPIVLQAVQNLFQPPARLAAWPDNDRRSRIVFITRNISRGYVADRLAEIQAQIPEELFETEKAR